MIYESLNIFDLQEGDTFDAEWVFTQADFDMFAELSGDNNPIHVDSQFAAKTRFRNTVSHGMLLYTVVWDVLKQRIPIIEAKQQNLMFPTPTYAGEYLKLSFVISMMNSESNELCIDMKVIRPNGEHGLEGQAWVRYKEGEYS